ncbi:MAG: metal ABC transporter permease [Thermoanaerobaculales bacterium]|jgi:manganese/zinc/iron transport system permease protein|nr:metal ABC transporter permease [Thermoanaerobaculales bacterium]
MDLLGDYTLRMVALGSGILGAVAGALGSFAYLRRQSLVADALSHAALPGIAVAFLLTGSKTPLPIMLGAAVAGWLATLAVRLVVSRSRVPYDSALGMALAVFFGLGLVLLTVIQKRPDAAQAGLESFLFGQAASLLRDDVIVMGLLGAASLGVLAVLWKELKLLAFDGEFGASLGRPVRRLDGLFTLLLVIAVVIGLRTVGVVLMSAMVVAPAAAARQLTDRFAPMVVIAAAIGVVSGVGGAVLSSVVPHLPTGPTIVLVLSAIVLAALLGAPRRGLVWRWVRLGRLQPSAALDPVLMHLYALSRQHPDEPDHGHGLAVLRTMSPAGADVERALGDLEARGLAQPVGDGLWAPTAIGRREAERTLRRQTGGEP